MAQEHDQLASLLFPKGDEAKLVNFKLFRAQRSAVLEDAVRQEIHSAFVQAWVAKTANTVTELPRLAGHKVNVAEMVKNL